MLQVLRRQLGMIFDLVEAAPVTEAHQPGPAAPTRSPQWCTCANCGDGYRFGKEMLPVPVTKLCEPKNSEH